MDDDSSQILLKLLAIVALVAANGFFVAAELAFVSVRRSRIYTLAAAGNRSAQRLLNILNHLDNYISATQVGITIASLALGWMGEQSLAHALDSVFKRLFGTASAGTVHGAAMALSFGLITVLHVVLGEQAPKIIALESAERVGLFCARPMELFTSVFRPLITLLNGLARAFVHLLGYKGAVTAGHHLAYSEEELKLIIKASKKHGVLEASEEELIHSVLQFTDTTVEEIMRPRPDMEMIPDGITLEKFLDLIADTERSRYPVYQGDEDRIVGVVHVKSVLEFQADAGGGVFDVKAHMRRPLFVPETRRLPDLLATLRREKTHMAIVVTEFGDVAGLVTMEDILEELVGEIQDEFDPPERLFEELSPGHILIQGSVPLSEVNERLGLRLPEGDYTSVGGYVFGRLGRAPKVGDEVRNEGFVLRVQAVNGLRVTRVVYRKTAPAPGEAEPAAGG